MGIAGKVGAVYVQTADAPVAFTDEATTANATYTRYTITNTSKRYWSKSYAVTVKKNSVVQTSGFSIEYAGGVIVFDSALQPTDVVTVSGYYVTVSQAGGFFNWSLDAELETAEATTFASQGWKQFEPTLKGFSGSAEAYWGNADFFNKLGQEVVVVLYTDAGTAKNRYEGYALITSDGIETAVDALIQETIEFTGAGALYYREG